MRKRLTIATIVLIAAVAAVMLLPGRRTPAARPGHDLVAVQRRDLAQVLELTGKVKPQQVTEVRANVSGRVTSRVVNEGALISAGHALLTVEPQATDVLQYEEAGFAVRVARLQMKTAARDLARIESLARAGLIPNLQIDIARDELERTQHALALAEKRLRIIEAERRTADDRSLAIRAPVGGKVTQILVAPGETVIAAAASSASSGTVVARIADVSGFHVLLDISEVDVLKIKAGMPALIRIAGQRDTAIRGHVSQVAAEGITSQNTTNFRAVVIPDEPLNALPEMSCDVDLILATRPASLALPEAAIQRGANGTTVIRVENGLATRVPVRTGLRAGGHTEILGGLREGDQVRLGGGEKPQ